MLLFQCIVFSIRLALSIRRGLVPGPLWIPKSADAHVRYTWPSISVCPYLWMWNPWIWRADCNSVRPHASHQLLKRCHNVIPLGLLDVLRMNPQALNQRMPFGWKELVSLLFRAGQIFSLFVKQFLETLYIRNLPNFKPNSKGHPTQFTSKFPLGFPYLGNDS